MMVVALLAASDQPTAEPYKSIVGVIQVERAGYDPDLYILIDDLGHHTVITAGSLTADQASDIMELVRDNAEWGKVTLTCDTRT